MPKGTRQPPLEENGFPDFILEVPEEEFPIYAECKRIIADSVETRIGSSIKKANWQVKNIKKLRGCGHGLAVLNVSAYVAPQPLTDELPPEIHLLSEFTQSTVSGKKNRSISGVVLLWDQFNVVNEDGVPYFLLVTRRRHLLVRHSPEPGVLALPEHIPLFEGQTAILDLVVR